jgi:hypothetical protein
VKQRRPSDYAGIEATTWSFAVSSIGELNETALSAVNQLRNLPGLLRG